MTAAVGVELLVVTFGFASSDVPLAFLSPAADLRWFEARSTTAAAGRAVPSSQELPVFLSSDMVREREELSLDVLQLK